MNTKNFFTDDALLDPREVCRRICLMRQSVPPLERNQLVWADLNGEWQMARIDRRLPGGTYKATYQSGPQFRSMEIIHAGNFGGLVDA